MLGLILMLLYAVLGTALMNPAAWLNPEFVAKIVALMEALAKYWG